MKEERAWTLTAMGIKKFLSGEYLFSPPQFSENVENTWERRTQMARFLSTAGIAFARKFPEISKIEITLDPNDKYAVSFRFTERPKNE